MQTSSKETVCSMYEESADWYADLMDSEIDLPVYADTLGRLAERITQVPGLLLDTSCGTGHMLSMYHERYDSERQLLGIDLSPRMIAIARSKLGSNAQVIAGDMCDLSMIESNSSAAVLSFFALHHVGPNEISAALREWYRVLRPNGQLIIATWEGTGPIDYGEASNLVAARYRKEEITTWTEAAGFVIHQCSVEPVEGMPMEAIYLEGSK